MTTDTPNRLEKLGVEPFGHQLDRSLARPVSGLAGHRKESFHARHVGHVGDRSLEEMGQESFDHVDRPVEVDVDHTLYDVVIEIVQPHERLDDASDVDQPIYRPMGRYHPCGECLGGGPVRDVDHEGDQPIPSTGQLRGLIEADLTNVDSANAGASTEKLQHDLPADSHCPHR
jgi:hypothetical protein